MLTTTFNTLATSEPSGIGALGLNVKSFIFQLISFLIVLWLLKRFVFQKIMKVLDARAAMIVDANKQALEAEQKLTEANNSAQSTITKAQEQSEKIISEAKNTASRIEQTGVEKAEREATQIKEAAKQQALVESEHLKREILQDTASLVADLTDKVVRGHLTKKAQTQIMQDVERELR